MDFFEVIKKRRSVRKFSHKSIPNEVIQQVIDSAFLAPNSSNLQTTRIYRVMDREKKKKLAEACLNQSAARTAAELFVVVAEPRQWSLGRDQVLLALGEKADKGVKKYYLKLIPFFYSYRFLAPIKFLIMNMKGLFKPSIRGPWSGSGIDTVCIKSAALVSENLMLALVAKGYDGCPMEGFDSCRVKKILNLSYFSHVVMVIGAGERVESGVWGEQFRMDKKYTYFEV